MKHLGLKSMRRGLAIALIAMYAACVFVPIAYAIEAEHHAASEENHQHGVDIEKYPEQHKHMGSPDLADAQHQTWTFIANEFSLPCASDSFRCDPARTTQLAGQCPDILIPPPKL